MRGARLLGVCMPWRCPFRLQRGCKGAARHGTQHVSARLQPGKRLSTRVSAAFHLTVTQRQDRERRGQFGCGFAERLVAGVAPASVLLLALLEGLEQLAPPGVLLAVGVDERVFAPRMHRFAEGLVIVVEPGL